MSVNHTIDEISEALRKNHGLLAPTAESLHVTRQAIFLRLKKSAALQAVAEESRETVKDAAESALFKAITEGDAWAVQFALRTIGRDRGYADKHEVSGPGGGPIPIRTVTVDVPPEEPS